MDLEDVSGRVLFPSPEHGPWLPLLRFADTTTTRAGDPSEPHSHRREEVLNYVLEGEVEYEDDTGQRSRLGSGAVALLTAQETALHNLTPRAPPRARWISLVVRCSSASGGPGHMVQIARGPLPARNGDGCVERRIAGRGGAVSSNAGLECAEIEFRAEGRCLGRVGRDRRAVGYLLEGSGRIDGAEIDVGQGALLEDTPEVEIRGRPGTRVILVSAPREDFGDPGAA